MKKLLFAFLFAIPFGATAQFWTEKATGFATPSRTLSSISIVDPNVIWAIALDNSAPIDYTIKEFTKSSDGGNTWTPGTIDLGANTAGLGISSISAVSATTAWISAAPETGDFGGIWKTTDGGSNWTKQTTASYTSVDSATNFVYFWDANNGIAQGDPESNEFEIYTTNDGGTTWTRVPAANIPDPQGTEFGYYFVYSVSGNTIWFGTDMGRIFKSADKGLNWTVISTTPSLDFAQDRFTFSDANKGLLMTYDTPSTALYNTTDGGVTWNPVSTTGFFNTDIEYIPGTSKVVSTGSATPFGSSYSLNDGVTWTAIDGVPHETLAFLNSTTGFSGGFNTSSTAGGIFKYTGTQLPVPSFDIKNQISVYPNPTNGILHLDSEKSSIREVAIFDLLGKQVYKSNFSDLTKVDVDLKSFSSGVYFLKVTSDSGNTETMKIMKN